jgi:hypothetical protein
MPSPSPKQSEKSLKAKRQKKRSEPEDSSHYNNLLFILDAKPILDSCFKMMQKLVKSNNKIVFGQIAS